MIKIFQLDGFTIKRKKGDHVIMIKSGIKRPLVIKSNSKFVPAIHIRTNIKTAGLSRDHFFKLIEKILNNDALRNNFYGLTNLPFICN